ncbi:MAG: hypothetical protein U9N84_12055 [Actinomycetota bacterium]|nr:hypothetical protein [Actinomycetota bacterium]
MFARIVSFGVIQLFRGARRGQPVVAAFGAAISIWGLLRKMRRVDKMVYSRELNDGETLRLRMFRGEAVVDDVEVGR